MESNKLQAQVRSLTRDVGALREALRQEEKKRERLAAHAKSCGEAATAAQSEVKQLTYCNIKLEQELRTARERADAAAAKSRGGLEAVRGRLAEVEHSLHQRSLVAHRQVQRMHSLVQGLQAVAMPLAVAAASSAAGQHALPALKSPLPGGSASSRSAATRAGNPEQLHCQFLTIFAGLSQLAALFSGGNNSSDGLPDSAAPLLLTAPDGSTKSVRWQDQNSAANAGPTPPSSADAGSLGSGRPTTATSAAAAAQAGASSSSDMQERERLAAEVQRLRAAVAEARHRGAAAEASSSGGGGSGSRSGSGRVEEAMRQLDAVVPQYRAAAQALQGQVHVLKEKLAVGARERAALQEEVAKWRGIAAKHEAAFAEAAAKLHTQEAQSLATSTQVQSQADRLQSDVEGLRRRCAELAARLQDSQRAVSQLQASLSAKDKLAATQQQTIQQLEATIREQQADIRSALDLVSSRPGPGPASAAAAGFFEVEAGEAPAQGLLYADGDGGAQYGSDFYGSSSGWEATAADGFSSGDAGWDAQGSNAGAGSYLPGASERLTSLLDAATAAADAAEAWVGGYGDGVADTAAAATVDGADTWDYNSGSGEAWSIPAVGGKDTWLPTSSRSSPQCTASRPASPSKQAAAPAGSTGQQLPSARSLQSSPAVPALATVEADIAGLEAALRSALGDLQI